MSVAYQHPRGTRAALNTLAAANGLRPGQIYFLTGENRLALATAVNSFTTFAREDEIGGGGGGGSSDPLVLATEFSTTTPAAPTAGVKMFARSLANRRRPAFIGPSGLETSLQSFLGANKVSMWTATGNNANAFNNASPGMLLWAFQQATTGTLTARNSASTNLFTRTRRLGFATGTGNQAGLRSGQNNYFREDGLEIVIRFGISGLPSSGDFNVFAGMSNQTSIITNANLPGGGANPSGFGIRRESDGWKVISSDFTTRTVHASLDPDDFPVNTANVDLYELRLFSPPGGGNVGWAFIRLNTGHVAQGTMTSALPAGTVGLAPNISAQSVNSNVGLAVDVLQIYLESDF